MKTLKQIGLVIIVLLFINGCGTSDNEHSADVTGQDSTINNGVKQLEDKKPKEHPDASEENGAQEVVAEKTEAETSSVAQSAPKQGEQKQRPEVQSGDEPTPERTSIHTIVLQNKYGKVAFNHAAHTQFIGCSTCHPTDPPSRIEMSRKEYHALCRGCHNEMGVGPIKCSSCHEH